MDWISLYWLFTAALGRSACHSPGVYPSTAGFLPPSYHPHQHHPSQYHPHRGSSPHHQHGNHTMGPAMGPPHHHHHHQTQSLQHLHYRQPPTCKFTKIFLLLFISLKRNNSFLKREARMRSIILSIVLWNCGQKEMPSMSLISLLKGPFVEKQILAVLLSFIKNKIC